MELNREVMVASWRSLLGKKFVHQGRNPEIGIDCIGLLMWGWFAGGWVPIDPEEALKTSYKRLPESSDLTRSIEIECDPIAYEDVQPGDALLFCWEGMDELPRHVAGVTSVQEVDGRRRVTVIHTHWQLRRVCEHGIDELWKGRVVSCWRLKGIS